MPLYHAWQAYYPQEDHRKICCASRQFHNYNMVTGIQCRLQWSFEQERTWDDVEGWKLWQSNRSLVSTASKVEKHQQTADFILRSESSRRSSGAWCSPASLHRRHEAPVHAHFWALESYTDSGHSTVTSQLENVSHQSFHWRTSP